MTDFTVRPIQDGEQHALLDVLVRALHGTPPDDEAWARDWASYSAERKFGAFDGDTPIGMAGSLATQLAVPGGKLLTAAAVDGVGVRADHTRKGVLTRLMAEQLRDCVRRGDLVTALHASEATIYGRFGYGTTTSTKILVVDRAKAKVAPELPKTGTVRLLNDEQAMDQIPELYRRIGAHRPGMIARPEGWWRRNHDRPIRRGGHVIGVHRGPAGDDGFVVYRITNLDTFDDPEHGAVLDVRDLHGASPGAVTGLWRYLLSVDLVAKIRAMGRPMDEPVDAMLTNPRACQVRGVDDELWLRLLDVPGALAARTYGPADPVVLQVSDAQLPENSGRYRVGAGVLERTDDDAELSMDVRTLAMIYLGEWWPSILADVGRVRVADAAALARADELFHTPTRPWCGTQF